MPTRTADRELALFRCFVCRKLLNMMPDQGDLVPRSIKQGWER
jgi:hypothetical protein